MFSGVYIAVCILVSVDTSTCSSYTTSYTTNGLELVSQLKEATQSSIHGYGVASNAVDGNTNGNYEASRSCTHTLRGMNEWWYLDLGSSTVISKIVIYNRNNCCANRLLGLVVRVGNSNVSPFAGNTQCGPTITQMMIWTSSRIEMTCNPAIAGQYVSVYLPANEPLTLCEVQVYKDIRNPVTMCPEDIVKSTDVDQFMNLVTWPDPKVTDNVDSGLMATCTPSSGSSFEVGLTMVTCSATDATGNEGNCSFVVTITDDEAPTLSCPQHILVNSDVDQSEDPVTWSEPTVIGNVHTGITATCTPASGSVFDVGSTIVTCSATDGTGNERSCSFVVHVTGQKFISDVGNPAITCPHNITVSTGVDQSLNPVTWNDPNVMDNVDTGLMATCIPSSGSSFGVGLTKVTCYATDATGNEGNCSFVVNIADDEAPTLSCPQHILVNNDVDQSEDPVTWSEPTVIDNVHTGITATCTPASGSVFDVGSTIVTCSATDGTGNEGSCSFVVHVTAAGQKIISADRSTQSGNKSDDTRDYLIGVIVILGVMVLVMTSAFLIVCRYYKRKYNDSTVGITMEMEDNSVAWKILE